MKQIEPAKRHKRGEALTANWIVYRERSVWRVLAARATRKITVDW